MLAKLAAVLILGLPVAQPCVALTVTVTITGVTGEIRVGEGPVFGHSSYQTIPPGSPFVLTYSFDEEKGRQSVAATSGNLITQSKIENTEDTSPGTNAVLQIGSALWEFGPAAHASVALRTAGDNRGESLVFTTRSGGNRVSAEIVPLKSGYWPKNGDWRASFVATSLTGSTASFSADNDRVSAKGQLVPESITVAGVDLDGQWLRATSSTVPGQRNWQLAHPSPKGGYIVEEVSGTLFKSVNDGSAVTPLPVRYWQAWRVPPGTDAPASGPENRVGPGRTSDAGEEKVTAIARFYEGVVLPSSFAAGNSPWAAGQLSSTREPDLSTSSATLPVTQNITLRF